MLPRFLSLSFMIQHLTQKLKIKQGSVFVFMYFQKHKPDIQSTYVTLRHQQQLTLFYTNIAVKYTPTYTQHVKDETTLNCV